MRRLKHLDRTTTAGLFDNNGAVQEERKSQYGVVAGEFWERRVEEDISFHSWCKPV